MTTDEDTLPIQEPVETESTEYDYGSEQQVDFTRVENMMLRHYSGSEDFRIYEGY